MRRAAALAGETAEERLARRQRERRERERNEVAVFGDYRIRPRRRPGSLGSTGSGFVDRSDWQVTLTIEEHDHDKGTVSGSMRAVGGGGGSRSNGVTSAAAAAAAAAAPSTPPHLFPPPPARPRRVVVRTWWTGEVVDNSNFSFLSNNHGVSSGGTDLRHWLRFRGFGELFPTSSSSASASGGGGGEEEGTTTSAAASAAMTRQFLANGGRSPELARAPFVYLRIKEAFFVTVSFFFFEFFFFFLLFVSFHLSF